MTAAPLLSVVVATFDRAASLARLLDDLAAQTLSPANYEVIVVDDGSARPIGPEVAAAARPYRFVFLRQENAGPAAARHRGIGQARGAILVSVDDDMRVGPDFLASHLEAHHAEVSSVALGPVHAAPGARLALYERFHMAGIAQVARDGAAGRISGAQLYSGNVSFRRADYLAAGGFDPAFRVSEDAELGIRFERAGARFVAVPRAIAFNGSAHASLDGWLRRSFEYGLTDARVAEKHADFPAADPWRFIFLVNAVSRPWLFLAALVPSIARPLAAAATRVALLLDTLRLERLAIAGATFAYGVQYFGGVGTRAGSRAAVRAALARALCRTPYAALGFFGRLAKLRAEIGADHRALALADARYVSSASRRRGALLADALQRIGFQMLVAYRVMRFFWGSGDRLTAKVASRMIRHLYAADLHWEAELAPGVVIVHGAGLIVSHAARVGSGCILFQHVTLGESIHPDTRLVGGPTLEPDVHVGPGATLLGPITVGERSKIMAGVAIVRSIPAGCVVEAAAPVIRTRGAVAASGVATQGPTASHTLPPARGETARQAAR